jgi:hypothetical protein
MAENKVSVACVNADEMRLRVTAEMTVVEWRRVLGDTNDAAYYSPMGDLRNAIKKGIEAIEKREDVQILPSAYQQSKEAEAKALNEMRLRQAHNTSGGNSNIGFCPGCGHPKNPHGYCDMTVSGEIGHADRCRCWAGIIP